MDLIEISTMSGTGDADTTGQVAETTSFSLGKKERIDSSKPGLANEEDSKTLEHLLSLSFA